MQKVGGFFFIFHFSLFIFFFFHSLIFNISDGPLYVLPWNPKEFIPGLHLILVTAADESGSQSVSHQVLLFSFLIFFFYFFSSFFPK